MTDESRMAQTKSLIQGAKKKLLAMTSVDEVVNLFIINGANVNSVGLPKNGHNIFSVWYEDILGQNKVAIIPNKEWADFFEVERQMITQEIKDLVIVTA